MSNSQMDSLVSEFKGDYLSLKIVINALKL